MFAATVWDNSKTLLKIHALFQISNVHAFTAQIHKYMDAHVHKDTHTNRCIDKYTHTHTQAAVPRESLPLTQVSVSVSAQAVG